MKAQLHEPEEERMIRLPAESVKRWTDGKKFRLPAAISSNCPHCRALVSFAVPTPAEVQEVMVSRAKCPACSETSLFVVIEPTPEKVERGEAPVIMYPAPTTHFPIAGTEDMEEALRRAYRSASEAYNCGTWSNVATSCRRTLEGLTKQLAPEKKQQPLAARLKHMAQEPPEQIVQPFLRLAELLREGGNLGAHFDEEREPDEEMAAAMMQLLDFLIEYLYVLPRKIRTLEEQLERMAGQQ